jgi:hypothetical protein
MARGNIIWGAILVLLGVLFLMDNLGLLPGSWSVWSLFWPLLLIGLGLRGVMSAFDRGARTEVFSTPLDGISRARVKVRHGAGELRIQDGTAPQTLVDGVFGGGVISDVRRNGDEADVDLRMPDVMVGWPFGASQGFNWMVGLDRQVALSLEIDGGASRMILDLRNLQVKDLRLNTGASATEIEFPAQAGETSARIESGAASVNVRVPFGVAARIRVKGALSSSQIDTSRFAQQGAGDQYESPDFASAENRLDLELQTGVGSVTVR